MNGNESLTSPGLSIKRDSKSEPFPDAIPVDGAFILGFVSLRIAANAFLYGFRKPGKGLVLLAQ
jgi:hypothetical protein